MRDRTAWTRGPETHGAGTIRTDPDFFEPNPALRGGGRPGLNDAEAAMYRTDRDGALIEWNRRWIQTQMDNGAEIHDLGRLGTRGCDYYKPGGPNVEFYGMEPGEVFAAGYHFSGNYHQHF